jgi:hypothetical protein
VLRGDVSLEMFFSANPVDVAVATAMTGEMATILLMR